MKTNKIERYDKLRFNATRMSMAGWIMWQLTDLFIILSDLSGYPLVALMSVSLTGACLMFIGIFRIVCYGRTIKKDPELMEALNDELYRTNNNKSTVWGYFGFILAVCVAIGVVAALPSLGMTLLRGVLFVGITTRFVVWLALNKRETYAGE